jgi:hypothetical protein
MAQQYVFLFRNNHPPWGSYYLIAEDRFQVMEACELAGYMVYVSRVPLNQVLNNIEEIADGNGNTYESMATASVDALPHACQQCRNRICGRPAVNSNVRPSVGGSSPLAEKYRGRSLNRYPGRSGEEVEEDEPETP